MSALEIKETKERIYILKVYKPQNSIYSYVFKVFSTRSLVRGEKQGLDSMNFEIHFALK